MPSLLLDLECPGCHTRYPSEQLQTFCPSCTRTLLARYDLERAKELVTPPLIASRPADLWRFEELLPLRSPAHRVSLGELETPILRVRDPVWAPQGELLLKQDALLPTGTFKARGMAMAVSRAWELGVKSLFVPSAGNAGAALAAYAQRAGLPALVFMPQGAPAVAREQVQLYGGELREVPGHIGDAGREGRKVAAERGAFDVSTLREPYRAEGKKTMGLEIVAQLGKEGMPEVIVYPTGGGTGLVGMAHAFAQLRELGWIDHSPRLYAAQAEGCAPVVEAIQHQRAKVEPVASPVTDAAGLRVPAPFSSEEILAAIRETGGGAVAVPEGEIGPAARGMAARHGIAVAREVGAALAGLRILRERKEVDRGERALVYSTGGWAG